jgi:uncharacterized spore protein YtfJ
MEQVQRLLDSIAELREYANVNAVFGEPVTVEGRTVISVAKVTYGFGAGVGHVPTTRAGAEGEEGQEQTSEETTETAGGTGAVGVHACPLAVIEVTSQGTWVEPIVDEQKLALAGSLLVGWGIFWLTRMLIKIFGRQE